MLSSRLVLPLRYGPTRATQRLRATVPPFIGPSLGLCILSASIGSCFQARRAEATGIRAQPAAYAKGPTFLTEDRPLLPRAGTAARGDANPGLASARSRRAAAGAHAARAAHSACRRAACASGRRVTLGLNVFLSLEVRSSLKLVLRPLHDDRVARPDLQFVPVHADILGAHAEEAADGDDRADDLAVTVEDEIVD